MPVSGIFFIIFALDDFILLFRGKTVVIKMDIERSDFKALLGGSQFFNKVNVILIRMEFSAIESDKVGKVLQIFWRQKIYIIIWTLLNNSSGLSHGSNVVWFLV